MALWKRILFWLLVSLVPALAVAVILFFCIDRSIKVYPGIVLDLRQHQFGTLHEVAAYLGGPPGDYTTVPYSFDPPGSEETTEQKEQRHGFMQSFRRDAMWITDDGCVMFAVDSKGKIRSAGEVKVYLSRQPNLFDLLKKRLRLKYTQ